MPKCVIIPKDTVVKGYGIVYAGIYLVEMPDYYDPNLIFADDLIWDCRLQNLGKVYENWRERN